MVEIDLKFVEKLKNTSRYGMGGLLYNHKNEGMNVQLNFVLEIFDIIKPENLLEIGTGKGLFDYFILLCNPEIKITTIDTRKESAIAINLINKKFKNNIKFIHGKSSDVLKTLKPEYDLAWVDGDHHYPNCISDLINCNRLKIKNILIDDWCEMSTVRKAVLEFIKKGNYTMDCYSPKEDDRGIAYLKRMD